MQNTTAKNFEIGSTIKEAWHLTKGSKWPVWAATLVMFALATVSIILAAGLMKAGYGIWPIVIISIVVGIIAMGFMSGLYKIAINRARGEPVSGKTGFRYFNRTFPVLFTYIIAGILANLIYIILFIPALSSIADNFNVTATIIETVFSLLVGTFLFLALPFAVDRFNSPFTAIAESFRRVKPHYFKVLALMVICYAFMMIAYVPLLLSSVYKNEIVILLSLVYLFIALVWLLPFFFLVVGVAYHKLAD